jgi:hypothetical protein
MIIEKRKVERNRIWENGVVLFIVGENIGNF